MQTLKIKNLNYRYSDSAASIFNNVNLEFLNGWTSVVGSNGSGKSTLLKLISKELTCEDGVIKGNNLVHYCHQSTESSPKTLEDFMLTYNSSAFKIRDLLGIKDSWLNLWDELSHGERKRLQIALALFSNCDVLLVDEPTNHLDARSREIVKKALNEFKGIGVIVSHDRELLDELSTSTVMIKNFNVITYNLKFSLAMKEYKNSVSHQYKLKSIHDEKLKKLDRVIQTQKERITQSKHRVSKKNINPKDSDAREKINLAKLTGKDKNDAQMLKRTQSRRKLHVKSSIEVEKQNKRGITFNASNNKKSFPIVIEEDILNISDEQKLSFARLSIEEGDKISIVGDNGSGKSSFIRHIVSHVKINDVVLYIPQEVTEDESKRFFQEVLELPKDKRGELFTLIKRLSSEPKQLMQSNSLSPGEIKKLLIAKGLLDNPSLIILDEPTNHLDLESIEAIESALYDYNGTLVVVSHDKFFVKNFATLTWSFERTEEGNFEIRTD